MIPSSEELTAYQIARAIRSGGELPTGSRAVHLQFDTMLTISYFRLLDSSDFSQNLFDLRRLHLVVTAGVQKLIAQVLITC